MWKQKVQFKQGFKVWLVSFAGWFVMIPWIYFLVWRLWEGPAALILFVVLALAMPAFPVGVLSLALYLVIIRYKFPASPWAAGGIVAASLINLLASYYCPPVVTAVVVGLGLYTPEIPRNLADPNGGLAGYIGWPFFL